MSIVVLKLRFAIHSLLSASLKRTVGRHAFAVVTETENGLFAVDPEDYMVGWRLRQTGSYGLDEIQRLEKFIDRDSTILNVGAHIGALSIPLSRLCQKVIAIEANPRTFRLLETNLVLNAISNCEAINIAASDSNSGIEFLLNHANSGGSKRVPIKRRYVYYYDHPQTISIESMCLDEAVSERAFDLIVMDIEGSEFFALKGMPEILRNSKVLVVEFVPHHLKNVSGVSVEQFLSVIAPYFNTMTIPSRSRTVESSKFLGELTDMYIQGRSDDGIIFEKL